MNLEVEPLTPVRWPDLEAIHAPGARLRRRSSRYGHAR